MVLSRELIISLGVTALGCTLIFLYFRNKISTIENKVTAIFDLIQNHQPDMSNMHSPMQFIPQQNDVKENNEDNFDQFLNNNSNNMDTTSPPQTSKRIEISDDESDGDSEYAASDDSLEISDNEYERENKNNKLLFDNSENINLGSEDINKIDVPLEVQNKSVIHNIVTLEEVDVADSLDSIGDEDDVQIIDNNKLEIEEIEVNNLEDSNDPNEQNMFDYNKLRVAELKALAEEKGLTNYKSLKKSPLIELLKSSE